MKKWMLLQKKADFNALSEQFHINPLIARLMINRGVKEEEMAQYLNPTRDDFYDPHLFHDGERAAEMILSFAQNKEKIRVIGDYDIDGIMSTYILHKAFLRIGADSSWEIPHRIADGYGLNVRLVEEAYEDGVKLIVTCDNGISAAEEIRRAKELGMTVVITDHHQIPYEEVGDEKIEKLPPADAIVNPHLEDCTYPFKDICGATVAWKLIYLLYEKAGVPSSEADEFLQNAAFATIGDVMPLIGENRSIVKLGLEELKETSNLGLRKLMEAVPVEPYTINSYSIGFILGPMLNAAGRIASARKGVELLLSTEEKKAEEIALELKQLNEERKEITQIGDDRAKELYQSEEYLNQKVLVLYIEDVSESVVGIIAGHVREATGKPVFILTKSEADPHIAKGSGRSIEAYPMSEKLHEVEDLLSNYGGHPMAAGLSIPLENIELLRKRLNENANLTEEDLGQKLKIDANMPLSYLVAHREIIDELNLLEPFGQENEKPTFAESHLKIRKISRIGKEKQFLKLLLEGSGGAKLDGLYFRGGDVLYEELIEKYGQEEMEKAQSGRPCSMEITCAYYPVFNEFRGVISVQINITDYLL